MTHKEWKLPLQPSERSYLHGQLNLHYIIHNFAKLYGSFPRHFYVIHYLSCEAFLKLGYLYDIRYRKSESRMKYIRNDTLVLGTNILN